jgi:hypothetical protein
MSQYGATKVAVESLIAQINSKCKKATLRCENCKSSKLIKQANIIIDTSKSRGIIPLHVNFNNNYSGHPI